MATRRQKLVRAVEELSRTNGLHTIRDLSANLPFGQPANAATPGRPAGRQPDTIESRLVDLLVNSTDGALPINELFDNLTDVVKEDTTGEIRRRLLQTAEVYFTGQKQKDLYGPTYENPGDILESLGYQTGGSGKAGGTVINQRPNSPTKENPNLSVVFSNNHRVTPTVRDINPAVIFLNAIPNVEMARSTPFLDVNLYISKPPKNEQTNQIQTLSLARMLLGAQKVEDNTALDSMINANTERRIATDPGSRENGYEPQAHERNWTVAGMELFTTPQTLVNADLQPDATLRSTTVIDKFRPFLTLNSVDIAVVPSTGLMSYKSATMNLTLHDRSRLAEVADLVRADLYGTNEIEMEYGWVHPDGESTVNSEDSTRRNPYGDLINGMRAKEKYRVVNSSFSMNEVGEVNITLQLAMRGGTDFSIELIGSDSEGVGSVIRQIQELMETVSEYRARAFGNEGGTQMSEIRGVQILDAAQDALNHTNFSSDLREALREFRGQMSNSSNPNAQQLINALDELYGTVERRGRHRTRSTGTTASGGESLTTQLRRSVIASVNNKLQKMATTADPFFRNASGRNAIDRQASGRLIEAPARRRDAQRNERARGLYTPQNGFRTGSTSLAKLLLLFVGEPLANSGNFDDVQLLFYPFNAYAGQASKINIGNFLVDNEYFAENFVRWRLDRVGRSANTNLRDFMGFIASTLLDDPAAISYGLNDDNGSLFRETVVDEDGETIGLERIDNPADYTERVNRILQNVTPDGSFKIPQVDFYVECLPRRFNGRDGEPSDSETSESILRIHIFDRKASSYDTLGALLASARDSELASVGNLPSEPTENESGVAQSRAEIHNAFISRARELNLIEKVQNTGVDGAATTYRIKGGPQGIRNFLYETMPYIRYGTIGSTVLNASLSSQQDAALSTVNLLRSFRRSDLEPNGENPGGLPMRIIPTELNMISLGCPLINFAQQFFIDFNTGTTADNIYGVVGVNHKLAPGEFTTDVKFGPLDAYGKYDSIISRVRTAQAELQDIQNNGEGLS